MGFRMRNYLSGELRRRFGIAWRILPVTVRLQLKEVLVSVKPAKSLEGVGVRRANGSIIRSEQDAGAWFLPDPTGDRKRGFIIVHSDFGGENKESDEISAVITILHELAHAIQYIENDWDKYTKAQSKDIWEEYRYEVAAWLQAGCWLARDRSFYKPARFGASLALSLANDELLEWKRKAARKANISEDLGSSQLMKEMIKILSEGLEPKVTREKSNE